MDTAQPFGFGSEAFFRLMKQLWLSDRDGAAGLLMDQVRQICRSVIRNVRHGFFNVTEDDFSDYTQESWIKLWMNMDAFLADPRNDPDSDSEHYTPEQKYSWARTLVLHEMQHLRDRKLGVTAKGPDGRRIQVLSIQQPAGTGDGTTPLGWFLPDRNPTPDQIAAASDSVRDALSEFFSLSSSPETLVSVAFVIVNNTLGQKKSMGDYAAELDQSTVLQVLDQIEAQLEQYGYDPLWLQPFRRRVQETGGDRPIAGLTAAKLANRKNDVQGMFRKRMEFREHGEQNRKDERKKP